MIIYLAGKITGDNAYKLKFKRYEQKYIDKGYTVLNPAILPKIECFEWGDYMEMSFVMLRKSDTIVMLPDWENSKGARIELGFALEKGLEVIYE